MQEIRPAILMFIMFTVICGGIYPALVTGVAHAVFPNQARGSLITDQNGREIGSALIGQPFSEPQYFWPRPSATVEFAYNPAASGGSNAGPTNPAYLKIVGDRVKALHDTGVTGNIPADLAQASSSGLDPHLSPKAAAVQIPRVAKARGLSEEALAEMVASRIEKRTFGLLGQERLNVLALNIALDTMKP